MLSVRRIAVAQGFRKIGSVAWTWEARRPATVQQHKELHMKRFLRKRRIGAGLAIVALTAATQIALGAGVAEARCVSGRPTTSTLGSIAANPVVQETPATGTCNGNNNYTGSIRRAAASMQPVGKLQVYVQNGGQWRIVQDTNVLTGISFSFGDNNSNAWMVLCWIDPEPRGTPHCGWGTNVTTQSPKVAPSDPPAPIFDDPAWHGVTTGF